MGNQRALSLRASALLLCALPLFGLEFVQYGDEFGEFKEPQREQNSANRELEKQMKPQESGGEKEEVVIPDATSRKINRILEMLQEIKSSEQNQSSEDAGPKNPDSGKVIYKEDNKTISIEREEFEQELKERILKMKSQEL